jgi:hypothetical protein
MTKALTIIIALFPSYASLFCDTIASVILLTMSTMLFAVFTGANEGEENMREKIQTGWIIHIIGIFIVIGIKNI